VLSMRFHCTSTCGRPGDVYYVKKGLVSSPCSLRVWVEHRSLAVVRAYASLIFHGDEMFWFCILSTQQGFASRHPCARGSFCGVGLCWPECCSLAAVRGSPSLPPGPSDPWLYIGGGYHLVSHGDLFKTGTILSLRTSRQISFDPV
jgi:hypothetical protein